MLGNAPTRIVVCAEVDVATNVRNKTSAIRRRLLTLSSDDHGQNTGILLLCRPLAFGGTRRCAGDQVSQRGALQNFCGRVAHIEKDLIERAAWQVAVAEYAKVLGVGKWRHRARDPPHDLPQKDFRRDAAPPR